MNSSRKESHRLSYNIHKGKSRSYIEDRNIYTDELTKWVGFLHKVSEFSWEIYV